MAEPRTDADVPLDAATLHALEARLLRATAAAEALLGTGPERGADGPPPAGWTSDAGEPSPGGAGRWIAADDAQRLFALGATMLEHVPGELQQRVAAALHELLVALRALVDWCLERVAVGPRSGPAEVQDIPIL